MSSSPPHDDTLNTDPLLREMLAALGLNDSVEGILFSFLQHQIRDVVFVLDVLPQDNYRFLYANSRFEETTGLPLSAVIGKDIEEVIPPLSIPLVRSKYRQAIDTGQSVYWDEVSEYPTGTRTGEVTVTPVHTPDGKCAILIGTVHDVTERYESQKRLAELEQLSRLALEAAGSGAFDWRRHSNQLTLSEHCQHILGYIQPSVPLDVRELEHLVHPEDLPEVQSLLRQIMSGDLPAFSVVARVRHLYGHWIWLRCQGRALQDPDGTVTRVFGALSDITASKEAEEVTERASLVFAHSSEAIAIADAAGRIIMVNPAFTRMRGYAESEIIGQTAYLYDANMEHSSSYESLWSEVLTTGHWKGEVWSRHKDGSLIAEYRSINAVKSAGGEVRNFIEIAADITKTKRAEELLWRQANYDRLTSLPNRYLFVDRLRQAIRDNHQANAPTFSLLFIDLDQFKEVNDTLGHSVGDRLLKEAAQRLLRCTRNTGTVARFGGDEFTVLLPHKHGAGDGQPHTVDRAAQTIIDAMSESFHVDNETLHLSASIGIAQFPKDGFDDEALLKHADQAMYEAKRHGRNRFAYFSSAMQDRAQTRRRTLDDLRHAIRAGELHLYYQPIVDLATGKIAKAESLLRWRHPERGWINPVEFIPLAEETGLIVDIGEWVFHTAIADTARWIHQQGHHIQVSVNVSPVQIIRGEESCARCMAFLASQRLPYHAIVIEVTEGSLLQNDPNVKRRLDELCGHGIALAIDDFGTGYSALSYLQQYQFEFLKIDRSFVKGMETGENKLVLCETIIDMAHKLGMRVIAEGIETGHETRLLRRAGCDYGQGFFFHRPIPAAEFEQLLSRQ